MFAVVAEIPTISAISVVFPLLALILKRFLWTISYLDEVLVTNIVDYNYF